MNIIFRILLIAALATLGTQALAQSRLGSRYEMASIPQNRNNQTDKVIILDKQSGELWSWSEPATIMYLGKIFPIVETGPFARIIQVNPEEKGR